MTGAMVLAAAGVFACLTATSSDFLSTRRARLFWGWFGGLALYVGFVLMVAAPAHAAEADLRPLWGYGIEVAAGVLAAVGGFGLRALQRSLSLREDGLVRTYLDEALHRALGWAVEQAVRAGDDLAKVEVRSQVVAEAASYAAEAVPDALRRFGINEQGLRRRLEARLGEHAPHPDQPVTGRLLTADLLDN